MKKYQSYDPARDNSGQLFDYLKQRYDVENDLRLAVLLGMDSGHISRVRHGRIGVGCKFILAAHERLGLPVKRIRELMALPTQRSK